MLITFEGIDGSGKSTQARLLCDRLNASGRPTILVREPGGTVLSERLRTILLDPDIPIDPFAELLLFSAARAQLVSERIRPALEAGTTVVCDRFYDSTTAYQGGGRNVADADWLRTFHARVTAGLAPDRTYLIQLEPERALQRLHERRRDGPAAPDDRMEAAGVAFQRSVAMAYAALAREEPDRIIVLDGAQDVGSIHESIWQDLERRTDPPTETSSR